jgi:hypothetical protein
MISTDENPGLRIESFAVINLRGVSTNKTIICFIAMQTYKEQYIAMQSALENVRQRQHHAPLPNNLTKRIRRKYILIRLAGYIFV